MARFYFDVSVTGTRKYRIDAETEKQAREKLENYDFDSEPCSEDIYENMSSAELVCIGGRAENGTDQ